MPAFIMTINLIILALILTLGFYYFYRLRQLKGLLEKERQDRIKQEKETSRRMYELAILKELGERIGYSLSIEKIIDIITGSLSQFMEYSAVSYMLFEQEKIIFKVHLEQSVSRRFIDDIRVRMLGSLSALLDKEFKKSQISETLTGAIIVEELNDPVQSFFNIPLVIADKVVGVLTVANTRAGLYHEEEMTILYKITKQASQAVSRLQEVVATEQGKLNAMVESMTEGVVMTDKDYRIMVANPAARKVVNADPQKELSIFDFIENLSNKFDIRGQLEESVKLDKILSADNIFIGEDFYQIFVAPVKSNLPILKGEILGGVVIFHNITKEKELEKMRDDFTSMMVHELRSPLDGIKKISKLMQEEYIRKDKKSYGEFTQLIYKDSSKMLEMVSDLLDVAKLEAGKFQVNIEPFDPKKLIDERLSFYKPSAQEAKIELLNYYDQNIPLTVSLDPIKIPQVLNNLLSNSLKFTRATGKIWVQCFIHKKNQNVNEEAKKNGLEWYPVNKKYDLTDFNDSLVVAVTDTGAGISEKNQVLLFNKFTQFKATIENNEKRGTGLGLVIAKGIVEAHQGRIGAGSEEGKGSTFYFALPLNIDINKNL